MHVPMLYADALAEDNYLWMFPCSMPMHLLRIPTRREGYNVLAMGQHLDDLAESFLMSAFHNGFLRTMKANYTVQYKCCVYYKLLMVCWKLQCYINDGWISMSFFNITNGVFAVNPPLLMAIRMVLRHFHWWQLRINSWSIDGYLSVAKLSSAYIAMHINACSWVQWVGLVSKYFHPLLAKNVL